MKNVKNILKGLLVGMVVISSCVVDISVVMASTAPVQSGQDKAIANHYTLENEDVKTVYQDDSYYINSDVTIQSIDYINNTVTFNKDSQLYSFYADNVRDNYYIGEMVNVTMDNKNEVVDCVVDNEPVVYNDVSVSKIDSDLVYVNINGQLYSFDNEEDLDNGWQVNDKCIVIMQDGRILEVRPVVNE